MKMSSWVCSQAWSALRGLDAQQLLLVVPLVQRPRLVESLVALQPDQVRAGGPGDRLGELGLADARRPLDEQRLLQRAGEVRRGGRRLVREVAGIVQPLGRVGRGVEPGGHRLSVEAAQHGARLGTA